MATAAAGVKAVATGVEMGMAAVTAAAKWPVVEPLAAPAGAAEVGLVEAELPLTKNLPFGQLIWKIPVRIALDALTFYKMVFDGEWKPATGIFKAHWEYFIYLPKWFAKRREVQKLFVKNQDRYGIFSNSIIKKVMLNGIKKFSDLAIKTNSI